LKDIAETPPSLERQVVARRPTPSGTTTGHRDTPSPPPMMTSAVPSPPTDWWDFAAGVLLLIAAVGALVLAWRSW
jgi:hypothetical protein